MDDRPAPDFVARLDQLTATLANLATPFAAYYHALVDAGLSRDEALTLTESAQTAWLEAVLEDVDLGSDDDVPGLT